MALLTWVEIFELASAQGLAFALRTCVLLAITYWCKWPWTNPHLVTSSIFHWTCPHYCKVQECVLWDFFGPKLVNAVKTSRILEELLGRYLREMLACDGRIRLAMCMTQEVWWWSIKSDDSSAVQMISDVDAGFFSLAITAAFHAVHTVLLLQMLLGN